MNNCTIRQPGVENRNKEQRAEQMCVKTGKETIKFRLTQCGTNRSKFTQPLNNGYE